MVSYLFHSCLYCYHHSGYKKVLIKSIFVMLVTNLTAVLQGKKAIKVEARNLAILKRLTDR